MQAVILAGGKGERLKPFTDTIPKPLIEVNGKAVIFQIIDYLYSYGLNKITITTNYKREILIPAVRQYIIDNYYSVGKQITINFPREDLPLGTAGSFKNARIKDTSLIIQGDCLTDIRLDIFMEKHKRNSYSVTIALKRTNKVQNYGIAYMDSYGRITKFIEKPKIEIESLVNTGIYIIEPEIAKLIPSNIPFDFAKDLFPVLIKQCELGGYPMNGKWIDIGTPEHLKEAKNIFKLTD